MTQLHTQDDLLRALQKAEHYLSRYYALAIKQENDPRHAVEQDTILEARAAITKAEKLLTPPITAQAHDNLVRACRLLVDAYARGAESEHVDWEDIDIAHDAAELALSMVD